MSGLNAVRGEARAVIGGQSRKLCVTFGALAEIETELGVSDMAVGDEPELMWLLLAVGLGAGVWLVWRQMLALVEAR